MTTSLYDKYYSEHNKVYMYGLIKKIVQKEYNTDISSNEAYNLFFKTNFHEVFHKINTEDISDLNRLLLTTQLNFFEENLHKISEVVGHEEEKLVVNNEEYIEGNKVPDELDSNYIIYSHKRVINLKNSSRFSYKLVTPIPIKNKPVRIEKVIIPIESMLPITAVLFIEINKHIVELYIRGTTKFNEREFGIYVPHYEKDMLISNDSISVLYKNILHKPIAKSCDVYEIQNIHKNKLIISICRLHEFKKNDYIQVCNYKKVNVTSSIFRNELFMITNIITNEDTIELECEIPDNILSVLTKGLFIMNMSIQNIIHVTC